MFRSSLMETIGMKNIYPVLLFFMCALMTMVTCCMAGFAEDLADVPNPLMGTNNDGPNYSRGNQYPAVTLPFRHDRLGPCDR